MNKGPESSIGYHTTLESLGIPQDALDKGVRNWQDYDDYLKEQAAREEYLETLANKDYDALTNFERHTLEKATRPEKAKEANNITNVTKPETKEKKTWFSRFKKSKFGKAVIAGAATFITLGIGIGKIVYAQSDNNNDRIEEAQKTPSSDTEKGEQEKNPLIGEELDNNEAEGVKFENLYYSTMDKKQYSQDLVGNIDGGIFNDAESFKKNIAEVHTNIGKGGVEASIAEHLGYDMSGLSANELGDQMENNLELREKVYNFIKDKYSRMENVKKVILQGAYYTEGALEDGKGGLDVYQSQLDKTGYAAYTFTIDGKEYTVFEFCAQFGDKTPIENVTEMPAGTFTYAVIDTTDRVVIDLPGEGGSIIL